MVLQGICVLGIVFALLAAFKAGGFAARRQWVRSPLYTLFSLAISLAGAAGIYLSTVGKLADELVVPLAANEIFEVMAQSLPMKDGMIAAVIRTRDGTLKAYRLKQKPPAIFKITIRGNGKKSSEPYPNHDLLDGFQRVEDFRE
jgi:hypothetical protein